MEKTTQADDHALVARRSGRYELGVGRRDAIVDILPDHQGAYASALWNAIATEADKSTAATEAKREAEDAWG